MKFREWVQSVPDTFKQDAVWSMKVYQYALFLADIAWKDIRKISENRLLFSACDQLYRSAGSVSANISEGYSRRSKLDQARFYEYALGSARECRGWYFKVRHSLEEEVYETRLELLTQIIKILLHIVPTQRTSKVEELPETYSIFNHEDIESYSIIENLNF